MLAHLELARSLGDAVMYGSPKANVQFWLTLHPSLTLFSEIQAMAAKQRAHADSLAMRLAQVEGAAEGAKAAASASQALSKCQRELMELQAEYNRVCVHELSMCAGRGACWK